jgi:hypothetical protein
MKINWGTKLVFFALLFMIFVVSMVFVISRQDVALVDDNYYEKGLNYQKKIDNSASIDSSIAIEIALVQTGNQSPEKALFILKSTDGDIYDANIQYYRPSNPRLDQQFKTQILGKKRMKHSLQSLAPGIWKAVLTWYEGEKEYTIEKEFER